MKLTETQEKDLYFRLLAASLQAHIIKASSSHAEIDANKVVSDAKRVYGSAVSAMDPNGSI